MSESGTWRRVPMSAAPPHRVSRMTWASCAAERLIQIS